MFVSHGTADQILPIDQCSRVIVPRLRSMGYDVTFREFEGRHEMPSPVLSDALRWIAATTTRPVADSALTGGFAGSTMRT